MIEERIKAICKILLESFEWAIREHKDSPVVIDFAEKRGFIMSDFERFRYGYCYRSIQKTFEHKSNINKLLPFYQAHKFQSPQEIRDLIHRDLKRMGILKESTRDDSLYCPLAGRFIIPIFNQEGEVVSFAGRKINDDNPKSPKYINGDTTAAYEKSKILYGAHQFNSSNKKLPFIIINEGYFDTSSLARIGYFNNVALSGVACSPEQFKMLFSKSDNLLFNLDGDEAGYNSAIKSVLNSLPLLSENRSIRVLFNEPGEDPDSITTKSFGDKLDMAYAQGLDLTPELEKSIATEVREEYSQILRNNSKCITHVLKYAVEREFPNNPDKQKIRLMQFACKAPYGSKTRGQIVKQAMLMDNAPKKAVEHAASHVGEINRQTQSMSL
ncbi:TPA: toprim domain-containing protein [Vibrio parahaemolyticus]